MPDSLWWRLHHPADDEGDELMDRDTPRGGDLDRLLDEYEPRIDTEWDLERENRELRGKE